MRKEEAFRLLQRRTADGCPGKSTGLGDHCSQRCAKSSPAQDGHEHSIQKDIHQTGDENIIHRRAGVSQPALYGAYQIITEQKRRAAQNDEKINVRFPPGFCRGLGHLKNQRKRQESNKGNCYGEKKIEGNGGGNALCQRLLLPGTLIVGDHHRDAGGQPSQDHNCQLNDRPAY